MAEDQVYRLPLESISVDADFNARDFSTPENKDHVARLAKLIGESGIQNPLRVRIDGDRVILVDGESRLRAAYKAKEAGSKLVREVPVLIDMDSDDETKRVEALVVKNTGKPLSMLETLAVVKRLLALGKSKADIQTSLQFSRTHLANLMLLDKATEQTFDYLKDGAISPTLVVDLLRLHKEPEIAEKAITAAVKRAEREAEKSNAEAPPSKKKSKRARPGEIIYTHGNFTHLIRILQDVYATLTPAAEYRKQRGMIKNALESVGAEVTRTEEPEEEAA
jgi:ParB/RepB/Spo0J family partition protein